MPSETSPPFEGLPADPQALAAAFQGSGASGAAPSLNWSAYGERVGEEVTDWLGGIARPLAEVLGPNVGLWLWWVVVALAVVIAVVIAGRILRSLHQAPQALGLEAMKPGKAVRPLNAQEYRRLALAAVERGDARLALTSVWWWFAVSVLEERPGPAMTTRDVITRARRDDLWEPARLLDKLRFGPTEPTPGEVRQLLTGFEGRL